MNYCLVLMFVIIFLIQIQDEYRAIGFKHVLNSEWNDQCIDFTMVYDKLLY